MALLLSDAHHRKAAMCNVAKSRSRPVLLEISFVVNINLPYDPGISFWRITLRFLCVSVLLFFMLLPAATIAQSGSSLTVEEAGLKAGCDQQKNPQMCTMFAARLITGSPTLVRDQAAAARYFSTACTLGGPKGCLEFGRMRAAGVGGKAGREEVTGLFGKACYAPKPLVDGCMQAGMYLLQNSDGGTLSFLTARDYFTKGCDMQNAEGCYLAGGMFHNGMEAAGFGGFGRDLNKAIPLLEKACAKNVRDSCAVVVAARAKLQKPALVTSAKPTLSSERQLQCAVAYSISSSLYETMESKTLEALKATNPTFYKRQFSIMGLDARKDLLPSALVQQTFSKKYVGAAKSPALKAEIAATVESCDRQAGYPAIKVQ